MSLALTKKTDYGLELMIALGKNYRQGPLSLRKIAQKNHLPYRFLGQVAMPLKEAGLIEAKEGKGGGYYLLLPPEKISVAQIVASLEGEIKLRECTDCRREAICLPKEVWEEIEGVLEQTMGEKTLSDLI